MGPRDAVDDRPLKLRSWRERFVQALWFEVLGVAIVSPGFTLLSGTSTSVALLALVAVSAAWAARAACRRAGSERHTRELAAGDGDDPSRLDRCSRG